MLKFIVYLVVIFNCLVPCFAPNPVCVHNGITEQQAKEVHIKMGITTELQSTLEHWKSTFYYEAMRMFLYALSVLSDTMIANNKEKEKDINIGAIVSISGNGGGILNLVSYLRDYGYTNVTIIVIFNPKGNSDQITRGDYLAFQNIINRAKFSTNEVFLLRDPKDPDYKYEPFTTVNVDQAIDKLKGVFVLFDGICGGGHGATTIKKEKEYTTSPVLAEALKILPSLCPPKKPTKIMVISNATPSGRTESGTWLPESAEFVCYAIMSTAFPFDALQVDKFDKERNVPSPQNILLAELPLRDTDKLRISFLTALKTIAPTMVADITAAEETLKTSPWVNIVAK